MNLPKLKQILLEDITNELKQVNGVRALVLGGSFAVGMATESSDIDIGIYYSEDKPFDMESFDKGAYRQGNNIVLAGTSKHKMFLIAGSDYGKQVVRAFELNNGNHEYIIQGQEGYTADEAAKFYISNYTKKRIGIMKVPIEILKFLGLFNNKFNYGANAVEALNNYSEKFETERT